MNSQRGHFFLTLFLTILILVIIVRSAQLYFLKSSPVIQYENIDTLTSAHPIAGTQLTPNTRARHRATLDGQLVFDVSYGIDQFSRRLTINPPTQIERNIVLMGCSMVFGSAIEDHQTLAHFLSLQDPHSFVTTYAQPGNGPQDVLIDLHYRDFSRELAPVPTLFIYVAFIGGVAGHPERLLGHLDMSRLWLKHLSHVTFDEHTLSLSIPSNLYSQLSLWQKSWNWLSSFAFFRPLTRSLLSRYLWGTSQQTYQENFVEKVRWMNLIAKKRGGQFAILIHPKSDPHQIPDYQKLLKDENITVIETEVLKYHVPDYSVPWDGHPNERFNKEFAPELWQQLAFWWQQTPSSPPTSHETK